MDPFLCTSNESEQQQSQHEVLVAQNPLYYRHGHLPFENKKPFAHMIRDRGTLKKDRERDGESDSQTEQHGGR
jgi:hypothetical protein